MRIAARCRHCGECRSFVKLPDGEIAFEGPAPECAARAGMHCEPRPDLGNPRAKMIDDLALGANRRHFGQGMGRRKKL